MGDDFWRTSDAGQSARAYYRPVVSLALAAQYQLFGRTSAGYHIVALLLHSACVLLVFDWLRRRLARTRSEALDSNAPTLITPAFIGAALFAIHPSRLQPVAWISGSTELWAALFALLGLWCFDVARGTRRWMWTSLLLSLSLLSKENALLLPLLLAADSLLSGDKESRPAVLPMRCTW